MRDVSAEATVGIRPGEVAGGLAQAESVVRQLLSEVRQLASTASHLSGVVVFLLQRPVDSFRVNLSFGEEELLLPIKGWAGDIVGTGMETTGVDWA